MKKLFALAALLISSVTVFAFGAPVFADSPGQLSNSPTNYKVRNVTQNGGYAQSTSATCNEIVKYSIILSNSDFGLLKDLTVKANLGTGDISASATNAVNAATSVSGKATVSVPSNGTLTYVNGSTVRIAEDGKTSSAIADGIAGNGVNVGNLNGSTAIFVQFQAKVNCPTPPEKGIKVCRLSDKKYPVTIKESEFDSSKYSKNPNDCKEEPVIPETPEEIPSTGPAALFGGLLGSSALGYGVYNYAASRRALKKALK
ncbi:MAG TPA: hypothetical protein PKD68_02165 [Candidatus Saccharibacteria bacterium]|nr:hypothetical protein [Candidatus Saccharibacteria bacterium]